jgi:hypothetical protein
LPNIDSPFSGFGFSPARQNKTRPRGRVFCCSREQQFGGSASFSLRFRHSARDNAVQRPTTLEDRGKPRNLRERYLNAL